MGRVQDKVAIITGGASGIGEGTVRLMAQEGAKVVIADVQADLGQALAEELNGTGAQVLFVALDVADEDAWMTAMETVQRHFGTPSILFNNAGILPPHMGLENLALADWRRVMSVNIDGVFLGIKHGIRAMKREGGSIINTSSIYGIVSAPYTGPYTAAKGAVRTLSKSAALECAMLGYPIRVNSVHPGFIETAMSLRVAESIDKEKRDRRMRRITPLKHRGEPADIAYGVLYLASDEAKYVTGTELVIDGGMTAQ